MREKPRKNWFWLVAFLGFACVAAAQYSSVPFNAPLKYATSLPASGAFPGQLLVLHTGNPPSIELYFWDATDSDWERLSGGQEENATFDGTLTVTGNTTLSGTAAVTGVSSLNGNVNLGSDEADDITANGPLTHKVLREDFDFQAWGVVEEDYTAVVATDTAENFFFLQQGSQLPAYWYSHEQIFAGTLTPFTAAGALDVSGFVDAADTDGVDFVVGGDPTRAIFFDEDNSSGSYAEVSITIATIANLDELYFGWALTGSRWDANTLTNLNTYAVFRVPDNAGDLDIETELNDGAVGNDDTGVTWADGQTKVLRVDVNADTVAFFLDGTAVAQTNAVLNFDDGDRCFVFFGTQMSAVGATAGVQVNYVEIGINQ